MLHKNINCRNISLLPLQETLHPKKDPVVIEDEICVHRERFASTIIHTTIDKIIFHSLHSTLNDHERGIITFKISPIKFLKLKGTY